MSAGQISISAALAGVSFYAQQDLSGAGKRAYQPDDPLPAAKASTDWDHDTATATLAADHGLLTGDKIDLYWAAGKRLGMTATVTDNDVALAGGHGDDLPADGTAVNVAKQTALPDVAFAGDSLTAYLAGGDQRVVFDFLDDAGDSQAVIEIVVPPVPVFWFAGVATSLFAGKTIASATVSNGSALATATPKLALALNT